MKFIARLFSYTRFLEDETDHAAEYILDIESEHRQLRNDLTAALQRAVEAEARSAVFETIVIPMWREETDKLRVQLAGLLDRLCVKADVAPLSQPAVPPTPEPLTPEQQEEAIQRAVQSRNTGPVASTRKAAEKAYAKQRDREAEQAAKMKDHPAVKSAEVS